MTRLSRILVLCAILVLSGCLNKTKNEDLKTEDIKPFVPEVNKHMCVKEIGMPTADAQAAKLAINEVMKFTQHQDYSKIKNLLTPELQKKLEAKNIQELKFDVFLPNASVILKSIKSYEPDTMFLVETNPKSTSINGFCNLGKELNSKNIYFHISNPADRQMLAVVKGVRGLTSANITLILKKVNNEWKVDYLNVYPAGASGKSTFEIYQMADQFKKEGRKDLAVLFYRLIEEITPNEPVMPAHNALAIGTLSKIKTSIPKKQKDKYVSWEVEPDYFIDVYDMKIVPFKEQLALFVGYYTETEEMEENNIEAELLRSYIIKQYPEIASYFTMLITEGTFDFPDYPGYESVKRIQYFKQPSSQPGESGH